MTEPNLFESMVGGIPAEDRDIRLWLALVGCFTSVERALRRQLRQEFDISLPRFDILTALVTFPDGLTMTELATKLGVSKGNVTGVVRGLREHGLVDRTRQRSDRRVLRVVITPRGKAQWGRMQAEYRRIVEVMLCGLPADQARQLTSALIRLQQVLDEADVPTADR
jgi:DNA-binding MarR family transcriptional regulator